MIQCKDLPETPILERIWDINKAGRWATWYAGFDNSVFDDEAELPPKLILAKMRKLIGRGLVQGCDCGCRGDYVVSPKGCELIGRPDHGTIGY